MQTLKTHRKLPDNMSGSKAVGAGQLPKLAKMSGCPVLSKCSAPRYIALIWETHLDAGIVTPCVHNAHAMYSLDLIMTDAR